MKIIIYDAMSALRIKLEQASTPGTMILRSIINEITAPGDIRIWVWDGAGGNARRRKHFPAYKTNRKPDPTSKINIDFIYKLMQFTSNHSIRMNDVEGDDVIAALTHYLLRTTNLPIEIHGRDSDLTALCVDSRVTTPYIKPKCDPRYVYFRKLMVGKPSDAVPGMAGFGLKSFESCNPATLSTFIFKVMDGQEWEDGEGYSQGLATRHINWLRVPENVDQMRAMWLISNPFPISDDELSAHLIQGKNDPAALEATLKGFHL